jgi:hypothetical protein
MLCVAMLVGAVVPALAQRAARSPRGGRATEHDRLARAIGGEPELHRPSTAPDRCSKSRHVAP